MISGLYRKRGKHNCMRSTPQALNKSIFLGTARSSFRIPKWRYSRHQIVDRSVTNSSIRAQTTLYVSCLLENSNVPAHAARRSHFFAVRLSKIKIRGLRRSQGAFWGCGIGKVEAYGDRLGVVEVRKASRSQRPAAGLALPISHHHCGKPAGMNRETCGRLILRRLPLQTFLETEAVSRK